MIYSLFIVDWLIDYIETPAYEMTVAKEARFWCAVTIILAVVEIACRIIEKIQERRKR